MPDFKKYFKIFASPEEVYNALTNPLAIRLWTGEEAIMKAESNTEFELYDGNIAGKNLSFVENYKIEQEWYFGEEEKEPSIVVIKLHPAPYGTSLELKHTNIPEEAYEDMIEGWEEVYMYDLNEFFIEDENE